MVTTKTTSRAISLNTIGSFSSHSSMTIISCRAIASVFTMVNRNPTLLIPIVVNGDAHIKTH